MNVGENGVLALLSLLLLGINDLPSAVTVGWHCNLRIPACCCWSLKAVSCCCSPVLLVGESPSLKVADRKGSHHWICCVSLELLSLTLRCTDKASTASLHRATCLQWRGDDQLTEESQSRSPAESRVTEPADPLEYSSQVREVIVTASLSPCSWNHLP